MLRCERLIVARGGRIVVDRLSLGVAAGEAAAVIGPSGCGKSSLLGAIAGALPIGGGDCTVLGHSLRRDGDTARAAVGYVPAGPVIWPGVEAGEFLAVFAAAAGLAGRRLGEAVTRGLDAAGLGGRPRARLDRLPHGQARRLLIARATLHAPPVLVLDDPFAGLDPAERADVERLVADMHVGGRTVIAAIDDAVVPDCFTHLARLDRGGLATYGPATFAAHAAGRVWRFRARCPGAATSACRCLAPFVEPPPAQTGGCDPGDGDTVTFGLHWDRHAPAELLAALVRAGIPVESFGLDPPWTVQLLGS